MSDTSHAALLQSAAKDLGLNIREFVDPKDGTAQVEGVQLHYLDWGIRGQKPMLLLHGGRQTAHSWDFFSLAMRSEHHVYALDQRGHGDSDWAPDGDYSRQAHLKDIHGFGRAMGLDRFRLIGLSMGGMNSITYAATYPENVEALVIVDVGPEIMRENAEEQRRFNREANELDFDELIERAHRFNPRRSKEHLANSLKHNLRELPNGKWTWKFDPVILHPDAHRNYASASTIDELWGLARTITSPTLIVRGGESQVFSQEQAEKLNAAIAGSRLVTIPKAGHTVPGDNPAAFEAAVRAFFAQL